MVHEQTLAEMKPFRVASLMAVEAAAKVLAQRDRRGSNSNCHTHDRVGNDSNNGRSGGGGGGGGFSKMTPQSRKSASPHSNNSPRSPPQASALPSGQRSVVLLESPPMLPIR